MMPETTEWRLSPGNVQIWDGAKGQWNRRMRAPSLAETMRRPISGASGTSDLQSTPLSTFRPSLSTYQSHG
jgi:hypothetical protein